MKILEFLQVGQLKHNWKIALVIAGSTILLVFDRYNRIFPFKSLDHLLLFFVIPFFLVIVIQRDSLKDFGFQIGDWKAGIVFTVSGIIVSFILVASVAGLPDFLAYYSSKNSFFINLPVDVGLDLIGWEFLFRGWLLFALLPVCGPYAIILQAVPFTIAHFGKPQLETLSCVIGGPLFGYVAWRTRSFLYPFLIHWFLSSAILLFT